MTTTPKKIPCFRCGGTPTCSGILLVTIACEYCQDDAGHYGLPGEIGFGDDEAEAIREWNSTQEYLLSLEEG